VEGNGVPVFFIVKKEKSRERERERGESEPCSSAQGSTFLFPTVKEGSSSGSLASKKREEP
jgi:hypothetical protein